MRAVLFLRTNIYENKSAIESRECLVDPGASSVEAGDHQ